MRVWPVIGVAAATAAAGVLIAAGLSTPAQGVRIPAAILTGPLHNVAATDLAANDLGADPMLVPGEQVIVAVSGFRPGATVQSELPSGAAGPTLCAGSNGIVRTVYQVPRTTTHGTHTLTFIGDGPGAAGPPPTTPGAMAISVEIPNLGQFTFTVGPMSLRR